MSAPVLKADVLFFQRLLRSEGLYMGPLDGKWGPITEEAAQRYDQLSGEIRSASRTYDIRSEACIGTLALRAQLAARESLGRLIDAGVNARIISGTRTYAEQNTLFRKGRNGVPGPRVTNAPGGHSNHNFGVAWDIGIFTQAGGYLSGDAPYRAAARAGKADVLEWGGDWVSFPDPPHYQLKLDRTMTQARNDFEAGRNAIPFA